MPVTRQQVNEVLTNLGVTNRFRLTTVSFMDLARGEAQCLTVYDWQPSPLADDIREAAGKLGNVITVFKGRNIIG